MSEKGKDILWGGNKVPEAIIEYGASKRLHGYLIEHERPKKTPSPIIIS